MGINETHPVVFVGGISTTKRCLSSIGSIRFYPLCEAIFFGPNDPNDPNHQDAPGIRLIIWITCGSASHQWNSGQKWQKLQQWGKIIKDPVNDERKAQKFAQHLIWWIVPRGVTWYNPLCKLVCKWTREQMVHCPLNMGCQPNYWYLPQVSWTWTWRWKATQSTELSLLKQSPKALNDEWHRVAPSGTGHLKVLRNWLSRWRSDFPRWSVRFDPGLKSLGPNTSFANRDVQDVIVAIRCNCNIQVQALFPFRPLNCSKFWWYWSSTMFNNSV